LRDLKPSAVPAIGNNDDAVASMVSFFIQQKNRSFPASSGKLQNAKTPVNDSLSPIKRRLQPQRISFTGQKCFKKLKTNLSKKREKVRSNSTDTDTESVVVAVAVVEAADSNVSILKGLRQSWW
jgi:Rieske Fe-S protein